MTQFVVPASSDESVIRTLYVMVEPGETGPIWPRVPPSESEITSPTMPKVRWTVQATGVVKTSSVLLSDVTLSRIKPMSTASRSNGG